MCNNESTSNEHVPPVCFFPDGHKVNLITVPSCPDHNLKKSKDDEYVRSIIAPAYGNNTFGLNMATTKVNRSFQRSTGLVEAVFKDSNLMKINGAETAAVKVNLDRWIIFFENFSNAIYFHDFGVSPLLRWEIITPSFALEETRLTWQPNRFDILNREILSLAYTQQRTSNPEIFQYFFYLNSPENYVYKFLFYEGFVVCSRLLFPTGVPSHNTANNDARRKTL
jgi:hypothetical protein